MHINAYLLMNGNCQEAFEFYARVLGGKIDAMVPHAGSPMEKHVPENWRDKIMHAALSVGGQSLMGSDTPPKDYKPPAGFFVSITVKSAEEAERIFHEFAAGGQVHMPMSETFWSPRFGMVADRFGTPWIVNTEPKAA